MKSKRTAGFTLIEMMVVIVIIGILAAVLITTISGRADKAKFEATKAKMAQISMKCEEFKTYHNEYPKQLGDLVRMPGYVDPKTWPAGGYFPKMEDLKDGWGKEFIYRAPGSGGHPFDLVSLGEDGRQGGDGYAADLSNHDGAK